MRYVLPFGSSALLTAIGFGQQARPATPATVPDLARSSWYEQVSAEIRVGEYRYAELTREPGTWSAPNRSQDLRSRVSAEGLEVFPRATSAAGVGAAWTLRLATKSFGRRGFAAELPPVTLTVEDARAELAYGDLTEWLENRPDGIEQGWTIASAPYGDEPLWIGLEIGGDLSLRIEDSGRSGIFVDPSGEAWLRYRGLQVTDATGRELEAHLEQSPVGVGIRIGSEDAVFPITVDPLLTGPAWTAEGDQAGAYFGASVASAGDVNGDGYSDVVVGAIYYDSGDVYEGSPAGLVEARTSTVDGLQGDS